MSGPTRDMELAIGGIVAGVDEVGTGPLSGPVCAAAVILPSDTEFGAWLSEINDSKKLTAPVRVRLAAEIRKTCFVGIGTADEREIDRFNILQASHMAMRRAVEALPFAPFHILVDGSRTPKGLKAAVTTVVKGDAKCLSIAAASIVAKVHRDAIMQKLHERFPVYGWDRNAGYPTPDHKEAIRIHGPCDHHRKTFSGVRLDPPPPAIADLFA